MAPVPARVEVPGPGMVPAWAQGMAVGGGVDGDKVSASVRDRALDEAEETVPGRAPAPAVDAAQGRALELAGDMAREQDGDTVQVRVVDTVQEQDEGRARERVAGKARERVAGRVQVRVAGKAQERVAGRAQVLDEAVAPEQDADGVQDMGFALVEADTRCYKKVDLGFCSGAVLRICCPPGRLHDPCEINEG